MQCNPLKINRIFGETYLLHLQGIRISQAGNQLEAFCKQSNWIAEILDYVGNRREIQQSETVPFGSSVGLNKPSSSHCFSYTTGRINRRKVQDNPEERGNMFLRNVG
jgi:hypothetical protein